MKNILFSIVLIVSNSIWSQNKLITGTVSDQDGPLPATSIVVEGTTNGTQSDFDGNYSIRANEGDFLVFTYVGYISKRVKIEKANVINVTLLQDSNKLEEVIVVGYGIGKRSAPTAGQLRRQEKKEIQNEISRKLQGKVAGVQITQANGASGNTSKIIIRGVASIKNNNTPLYIVDGVPVSKKKFNKIKPNDIVDVMVVKNATASAIYGASGQNGVVLVTTGNANTSKVNDEVYAEITENQFEKVNLNPLSTFSIDVDTASYSNIRRMLNNGQEVPVDAVKIEEMINYFDYQYPQPTEHPFAINTEVAQTPWNKDTQLVKIGLQGKTYKQDELPASNLTFLIDVSGSMNSANKLPLLKSAFKLLVKQLRKKDKVAIVVYAGAAGVVLEPTLGNEKEKINTAINNLTAGGSTAGGEGIKLAYKLAEKGFIKNGNNRVILATDGDFNVGLSSDKAMKKLIEGKRESGVFLSVLGFGIGNYKDSKMEKLADKGNGNHAYIDSMQEAQKVFGKEFGGTLYTIAKDVKIQVEFNPNLVQAYRLIGYENRMLADEDFIDDTKDAGELGSGHTVTALYEVIPVGVKSEYLKEVHDLKYTKTNTANNSNELLTVKFRYKKPRGTKSIELVKVVENSTHEISGDFSFAAAVALFGMQIRGSKFHNKSDTGMILNLANKGTNNDAEGYRKEFIRLVKSYKNSI